MENQSANKLLITTDHDANHAQKSKSSKSYLLIGIIWLVVGIFLAWVGDSDVEELNYFSKDMEVILAYGELGFGFAAIAIGIIFPFLPKIITKINVKSGQEIRVYEDHIEGKAIRRAGNVQQLLDIYETLDRIGSVSVGVGVAKGTVIFQMKDGSQIHCVAFNADDVAAVIRERLR